MCTDQPPAANWQPVWPTRPSPHQPSPDACVCWLSLPTSLPLPAGSFPLIACHRQPATAAHLFCSFQENCLLGFSKYTLSHHGHLPMKPTACTRMVPSPHLPCQISQLWYSLSLECNSMLRSIQNKISNSACLFTLKITMVLSLWKHLYIYGYVYTQLVKSPPGFKGHTPDPHSHVHDTCPLFILLESISLLPSIHLVHACSVERHKYTTITAGKTTPWLSYILWL